jgi:hypothetical protein
MPNRQSAVAIPVVSTSCASSACPANLFYLVEWAIALHGMYESQLSVIFLFFLSQWTWHEGNISIIISHC